MLQADDMSYSEARPYNLLGNSCTWAVRDILQAGSMTTPCWAKTP